jgi:hypothetical protein
MKEGVRILFHVKMYKIGHAEKLLKIRNLYSICPASTWSNNLTAIKLFVNTAYIKMHTEPLIKN